MAKKTKPSNDTVWVNPQWRFRGPDGDRGWNNHGNITLKGGSRFLELADIALKQPIQNDKKKKVS